MAPQPTYPGLLGGAVSLSRRLAALRTRDEQLSRPGSDGGACGAAVRPGRSRIISEAFGTQVGMAASMGSFILGAGEHSTPTPCTHT